MTTQSLAELKAENAAEDNQDGLLENEQVEEVETQEHDGSEDESTETEDEEDGQDVQEVEGWLVDDSEEEAKTVPVGVLANVRGELKGKLKDVKGERDSLRDELDQLKQQLQAQTSGAVTAKPEPKYDDYGSDAEYQKAYMDWKFDTQQSQMSKSQQEQAQQRQLEEQQRQLQESVSKHYERAGELINKHGISAEVYQQADTNLRRAVDNVLPGHGDSSVDLLLSNLGEGSEKVAFAIGKNQKLLDEFQSHLRADPSGFKAAMYLGEQKAKLTQPIKRKSNAPKPGASVKGDAVSNPSVSALKKKYDAAHKKNNGQEAFRIKRQAKKDGVDTSKW